MMFIKKVLPIKLVTFSIAGLIRKWDLRVFCFVLFLIIIYYYIVMKCAFSQPGNPELVLYNVFWLICQA